MALTRIDGALTEAPSAADRRQRPRRHGAEPAAGRAADRVLLLGALYCLLPVAWVLIASTKNNDAAVQHVHLRARTGRCCRTSAALSSYAGGVFWHWMLNTALYAGGGALLSAVVSALTGYALAKFRFRGRSAAVQPAAGRGAGAAGGAGACRSTCCSPSSA